MKRVESFRNVRVNADEINVMTEYHAEDEHSFYDIQRGISSLFRQISHLWASHFSAGILVTRLPISKPDRDFPVPSELISSVLHNALVSTVQFVIRVSGINAIDRSCHFRQRTDEVQKYKRSPLTAGFPHPNLSRGSVFRGILPLMLVVFQHQ